MATSENNNLCTQRAFFLGLTKNIETSNVLSTITAFFSLQRYYVNVRYSSVKYGWLLGCILLGRKITFVWAYIYVVGCSHYEYLVAAYITSGRIYTPLLVDAKTAWHSKGK